MSKFFQKIFFMNKEDKAQAALVDSMFFTLIVAAVCASLFYFVVNYGIDQEQLLTSFYSRDFAMDSLKVITYINVLRDGRPVNLNSSDLQEYDYLLALIKEDYAQNKRITLETRKAIANTVHSVLLPFEAVSDYVFYIIKEGATPSEVYFVALILATHDPSTRDVIFYSCEPSGTNILEKKVFPKVGKIDSAKGKITLSGAPFVIGLETWISKDINALMNISTDSDFNCIELPDVGK